MTYKKRLRFAIISCFVISALVIGLTFAFFTSTDTKVNTLSVGSNECQIINTFNADDLPQNITKGTVVPMKISVLNTGCEAYVRIFVDISDESLKDKMTIDYNNGWNKGYALAGKWCWWYYGDPVEAGDITENFCESITFNADLTAEERENLEIIIYAETLQTAGFDDDNPFTAFDSMKGGE